MTVRPRSDWGARPPKATTPLVASEVRGVAIHWLGPAADASDPAKLLRGIQAYHVGTHKWSDIAYSLAVDPAGDIWVLRGLDLRSAANGDANVNRKYLAVVALLGQGQRPTPAMLTGLRQAVALCRARYPHATEVHGHQEVSPDGTACPGPDLQALIRQDFFKEPAMPDAPAGPPVIPAQSPVVNLVPTASGNGYWIITASGEVFGFGDAPYFGRVEAPRS